MKAALLGLGLALALALAAACHASPSPGATSERAALHAYFTSARSAAAIRADLAMLCDRIGGRITGSRAGDRAVAWGVEALRALGIPAEAEPYELPIRWLPERASVTAIAPEELELRAVAAPNTASTAGPIEGPLVDVGAGTPEAFAALGARGAGAFALVSSAELRSLEELFADAMRSKPLIAAAVQARVAGLVLQSNRPDGILYTRAMTFGRTVVPLPVVVVARDHAARLARLRAGAEVRLRVDVSNDIAGPVAAHNVVGELRGTDRAGEVIVLGAHLDSWDLGTGAEDNAANVALVLDVARAFRALGLRPRRTVRFVLFTGEEQGLWGSTGYVARHRRDPARHAAAVIFDLGSGRTTGFALGARPELRPLVEAALAGLDAGAHTLEASSGTDNFAFLLDGVPNLVALQDVTAYLAHHHSQTDTLERVDLGSVARNAEIAAALIWHLATAEGPLPRRHSRAEVDRLLVEEKLVDQMQAFDQWDDWQAQGREGR